jgi:hypothetical protein
LLVNVAVIGSALYYLIATSDGMHFVREWESTIRPEIGDIRKETGGPLFAALRLALLTFPAMAIGLSGFELSMASAPMVHGDATDDPKHPVGRIRYTRLLMLAAAVVMSLFVITSIFVVTLLVWEEKPRPDGEGTMRVVPEKAVNRSLSYLAHGDKLRQQLPPNADEGAVGGNHVRGEVVVPFAGPAFGFIYDLSTILILCLAGASATISLQELVPEFLSRFGMQMTWAHRIGVITHLFNITILLVTVVFQASVTAQQWAYAASVLALLFGASLAATLDVRKRLAGSAWRWPASMPFLLISLLFAAMGILIVWQNAVGVAIALLFVLVVLVTAIVSRYLRSSDLRFEGFRFSTPECEARWNEIRKLEFQALVPHDPHTSTLRAKEEEIRHRHRIATEVSIIFIEVTVGDPSDFHQRPLMRIDREGDEEVIRVSRCTSISHVIAAIALQFRDVGEPPELFFSWSESSPLVNSLTFFLLGEGNIPLLVRALLHKAEPDESKRPRVIVG